MDYDQLLTKPVLVVGSARSGTTVLGQLLEVHSELFELEEPRLTWRWGNDGKSDMFRPEDARDEVIAYIRGRFAEQVRASGRTRLLEKTPSNALRMGFVDRVLPDSKIIHIIRNGVDSSLSIRSYWNQAAHGTQGITKGKLWERVREMQLRQAPSYAAEAARRFAPGPLRRLVGTNLWGPRLPGMREMVAELDLLEVCALQWRTSVEAARQYGRTMPAGRYLEVRLEELSLDKFKEVLEFAELTPEPAVLENFEQKFKPGDSTRRKSQASEEDLRLLRRWIEPTMDWLGYSPDFLSPASAD